MYGLVLTLILSAPILDAARVPGPSAVGERGPASSAASRAVAIERERGWTQAGFRLADPGLGVGVAIEGRARLGRAEILFESGEIERVELRRRHTYGRGLYELARFDGDRRVLLVRLEVRARSRTARIRAVLLRDSADLEPATAD